MSARRSTWGGRRARSRGGFASVELMVSLAVLLVAVLSTFGSQLATLRSVDTSRETLVALADLRACMERILLVPAAQLPEGGEYADGQPIAAYQGLHLEGEVMVATYPGWTSGGEVQDPQPVVLTVTWNDFMGRGRSLALRSLVAR